MKYLAETERKKDNFVLYIDMDHDLGSTEGLYVDQSLSLAERATRLIVDVIGMIHDRLVEDAFAGQSETLVETLDAMIDHFSEIVVVAEIEQEQTQQAETTTRATGEIRLGGKDAGINLGVDDHDKTTLGDRYRRTGKVHHRIHFGAVAQLMRKALQEHNADRFWLLFDEWSGIPIDLQPYLAEMLRKLFFGAPKVTIRIAAIPHRSQWRIASSPGDYVGLEIGAEIFPLLDLDEFVVFPARSRDEQTKRATRFFSQLIYRHIAHALHTFKKEPPKEPDRLIKLLFTQVTAFQETIRAAEGVPRDTLSIVSRAALRSGDTRISTEDVRDAASQLYQTTKATHLNANPVQQSLLNAIIHEVISGRKARAFLLAQENASRPLIQRLVDDRILHIIKRGYSSKDDAGERFDVLQIDYGCYVHLLKTSNRASQLMLGIDGISDDGVMNALYGDVEVPEEDYRAIRRAVLDLPAKLRDLGLT